MRKILSLLFSAAVAVVIIGGAVQAQSAITFCDIGCNACNPPAPVSCYCDDIEWRAVSCTAYCEGACDV